MLKQACEGALVAVWAESDQARDVCEGALAVVWVQHDQNPVGDVVVLVAWVEPKQAEEPCR